MDEFPYFAKRALAKDFKEFELRWISLFAALLNVMGDRDLLIGAFITVCERLSLLHGLVHDLMSIDLAANAVYLHLVPGLY